MDELLIAIAGAAFTWAIRLFGVPGDVVEHDQLIQDADEDLDRYVVDEDHRLQFELKWELPVRKLDKRWTDSQLAVESSRAVEGSIHRYRDQELLVERRARDTLALESTAHRAWRLVWFKPRPTLSTPAKAAAIVDSWVEQIPALPNGDVPWISDPRTRTVDDLVEPVDD